MASGLYSGTAGLALGVGLYRSVASLWGGTAGLQSAFGCVVVSLFANGEQGGWYDFSDLSTVFQDDAGTTPVTAAGQTVGKILDKSGRGNHLTQATAASRPQYNVDGSGYAYLLFDGVDDGLVSPTITPGTDVVQLFTGLRKLSDAATGVVAETSAIFSSNNGSIALFAPPAAANPNATFFSRGTINASANRSLGAAPVTAVVSGLATISGDNAVVRTNGVAGTPVTTDQGTGNYLAYPLYVGRRGGTTAPFSGRLYQLVLRFGPALDATTLAQVEAFVNSKTGAY